jgi:DNA-binding CsgD family transcriptional regulator
MHYISLIAFFVALAAAFTVLRVNFRFFQSRKSRFSRSFISNILFFNLLVIISILFNFSTRFFSENFSPSQQNLIQICFFIPMTGLKFLWLFSFLRMSRHIIDVELSKPFQRTYIVVALFLMSGLIAAVAGINSPLKGAIIRFLNVFIESLIIISGYLAIIILLIRSLQFPQYRRKRGIYLFSNIYIVLFSTILVSLIVSLFIGRFDWETYTLVYSIVLVLYNLLPLTWLRAYGSSIDAGKFKAGNVQDVEQVFNQYAMSEVEKKIIRLICKGQSNQKIAEQLAITRQTVRDHNRSIFRKLGIKSRVLLLMAFRKIV